MSPMNTEHVANKGVFAALYCVVELHSVSICLFVLHFHNFRLFQFDITTGSLLFIISCIFMMLSQY